MDDVNAVPGPSTIKPKNPTLRRRLNAAGAQVLEEYWDQNPGKMPSIGVRHELTDKIKQIAGNDFYKVINTTDYFKRRLSKLQAEPPTPDPQFPSLTKGVLQHLEVLLRSQPLPPPDVIQTWAALLSPRGATYQDIVNWVHITGLRAGNNRLPTPANTVTPEHSPSLPPASPVGNHNMKRDPMHSPVLPPLAIPPNQRDGKFVQYQGSRYPPFTPTSTTSSASPAPPYTPVSPNVAGHASQQQAEQQQQQQPQKRPHVPILQAIICGVADAVSSPNTSSAAVPSSATEFNEMFAPYEKQMVQLMHVLEHS